MRDLHREDAARVQGHDPRQLPQHRLLRRELLRHPDRGRDLLQQAGRAADAGRVGAAGRPAARAVGLRPVPQPRGRQGAPRPGAAEPGRRRQAEPGQGRRARRRRRSRWPPTSPPRVKQGCANAEQHGAQRRPSSATTSSTGCETVNGIKSTPSCRPAGSRSSPRSTRRCRTASQAKISQSVPATSPMTAVLPVVDPHTGDILAMATSKHYGIGPRRDRAAGVHEVHRAGRVDVQALPAAGRAVDRRPQRLAADHGRQHRHVQAAELRDPQRSRATATPTSTTTRPRRWRRATAKSSNTFFVGLADQLFDCNLQPIVDMMAKLGMTQPAGARRQDIAAADDRADDRRPGSAPSSSCSARSRPARWSWPAPTPRSRTAASSTRRPRSCRSPTAAAAVAVKRTAGRAGRRAAGRGAGGRHPDRRHQGRRHVGRRSSAAGTAATPASIAGKTGTNAAEHGKNNSSVWFVGMTPTWSPPPRSSTSTTRARRRPGCPARRRAQAYGDYAAKVWLQTLRSTLGPASTGSGRAPTTIGAEVPTSTARAWPTRQRTLAGSRLQDGAPGRRGQPASARAPSRSTRSASTARTAPPRARRSPSA